MGYCRTSALSLHVFRLFGQRDVNAWKLAFFICFCSALLLACTPQPRIQDKSDPAGITVAGMVIRNELPFPVTDVMIIVPATGSFAGCGNVMQGTECRTSFEGVNYSGHPLQVSWKEYGTPHQTGEFVVEVPRGFDTEKPGWFEVVIFAMGQAGARFIQ